MIGLIQLGLRQSGYAVAFPSDKGEVRVFNISGGEDYVRRGHTLPTCVLVNDNDEFLSFGHDAEEAYQNNALTREDVNDLRMYKEFLDHAQVSGTVDDHVRVRSTCGNFTMPLIKLTVMTIKCLSDVLLSKVGFPAERILWIVSAPSCGDYNALVRKAANQAGIVDSPDSENLLALDEASAMFLFCNKQNENDGQSATPCVVVESLSIMMTCDDSRLTLSLYQNSAMNEFVVYHYVYKHDGWSQTKTSFVHLMEDVFGKDVFNAFRSSYPDEYLAMKAGFSEMLLHFEPSMPKAGRLRIASQLAISYREKRAKRINRAITKEWRARGFSLTCGVLSIPDGVIRDMLSPVYNEIKRCLSMVKKQIPSHNISKMFLVENGICSLIAEDVAAQIFGNRMVIFTPEDSQHSVLRGSLHYHFSGAKFRPGVPRVIAQKTYCLAVYPLLERSMYDVNKTDLDRDKYCGGPIYMHWIRKGAVIHPCADLMITCTPLTNDQNSLSIILYNSDDDGQVGISKMTRASQLLFQFPGRSMSRIVHTRISIYAGSLFIECCDSCTKEHFSSFVIDIETDLLLNMP